jgi:hypothetical protein
MISTGSGEGIIAFERKLSIRLVGRAVLSCLLGREAVLCRFSREGTLVETIVGANLLLDLFEVLKMGQMLLGLTETALFSVDSVGEGRRGWSFMRPTGGGIEVQENEILVSMEELVEPRSGMGLEIERSLGTSNVGSVGCSVERSIGAAECRELSAVEERGKLETKSEVVSVRSIKVVRKDAMSGKGKGRVVDGS